MNELNANKQTGNGKKLILAIGIPFICVVAVITYYIALKDSYVAKVGNVKISQEGLNTALNKQYGATVLDTLISNKVIELEAKKQDVSVSKKTIQSQLDTLATQYGSEEALESALASSNMTMNDDSSSVSNSTSS